MIYIIALLISLLLCHISKKTNSKKNQIFFFILSTLPLTLLSAFRYKVGTDYIETYEKSFIYIKYGNEIDGYDLGFTLLNKLILLFTGNPQWLFVITSIIISFFIFNAIKRSQNIELSLFLYVATGLYFMGMNQVKQFVGMSICLYALYFYEKNKIYNSFILIFIASSFHLANLIFFIPILLCKWKSIYKFLAPKNIMLILLGVYIFSNLLVNRLFEYILIYSRFYDRYTDSDYTQANFSWAYLIMGLFVLFLFFYLYKKCIQDNTFILYYMIQIFMLSLVFLSKDIMIAPRLADTYFIVNIISIPYLYSKIKNKSIKRFTLLGIICVFSAYTYWSIFMLNNHGTLPYHYRISF